MFVVGQKEAAEYFLEALLFGTVFALVYLLFGFERLLTGRIFRKSGVMKAIFRFLFDFFFCIAAAFFDILFVYSANRGEVRLTALIMEAFGFAVPVVLLRRTVEKAEKKVLSKLYAVTVLPLCRAVGKVKKKAAKSIDRKRMLRFDKNSEKMLLRRIEENVKKSAALIREEKRP